MRCASLLAAGLLAASAGLPTIAWADPAPAGQLDTAAVPLYLAVPLDQQGKLAEALPLYRAQAEKTATKADRLRYAGALLRAGRVAEAKAIYDQVARETGSVEHGGAGAARASAICASSALANGFPAVALPYAWQAHRLGPNDPTISLLLVRALAASGNAAKARTTLNEIARESGTWVIGQRMELARWRLLTGDTETARSLLQANPPESVGQMFRDSILANVALRQGDWAKAAATLAESERKVPPGLTDKRVDRAWRNTQRELWSVQLRRAICLWKAGNVEAAIAEAVKAQHSDEEYVRSAAVLLLAAGDVTYDRRDEARVRLQALAGHDARFAPAAGELEKAPAAMSTGELQATLRGLDHSADFVAQPLCEIVAEAVRPPVAAPVPAARSAAAPLTASSAR